VPTKVYDESLAVLRRSLEAARLGHTEKSEGLKRLDKLTRSVEKVLAPMADFDAAVEWERRNSRKFGGRTVFDREEKRLPDPAQRCLF
jgi:hypothetical protein